MIAFMRACSGVASFRGRPIGLGLFGLSAGFSFVSGGLAFQRLGAVRDSDHLVCTGLTDVAGEADEVLEGAEDPVFSPSDAVTNLDEADASCLVVALDLAERLFSRRDATGDLFPTTKRSSL